jgi:hypothetical protein
MKRVFMTLTALLFIGMFSQVLGQQAKFQAAYVYHFTKYVSWPGGTGDFVIGIMGDSELETQLKQMAASKTVGSRPIKVINISGAGDVSNCDIAILGKSKSSQLSAVQSAASANNVLVVTNSPGSGKKGAGINFVLKDGKLVFEVNKSAIETAGLQASPKLLQLGISV